MGGAGRGVDTFVITIREAGKTWSEPMTVDTLVAFGGVTFSDRKSESVGGCKGGQDCGDGGFLWSTLGSGTECLGGWMLPRSSFLRGTQNGDLRSPLVHDARL